ncbi:hypothetical protein ACFLSQ_10105 [Bacteroidota bacterium]
MKIRITLLLFLCANLLYSEDNDTSFIYEPTSFDKFIERIEYSKNVKNHNIIGIFYGYSGFSYQHKDIFSKLAPAFLTEVQYGFTRMEENYLKSGLVHFASETAFLGNYSSHMTLKQLKSEGKTTDCWRFGFNFSNGYGYDSGKIGRILLYHSGSIAWYKIDFENPGESVKEQQRYDVFDEKFRFGSSFGTGVRHYFYDGFSLDIGYEHSLVFPKFLTGKWMTSAFTELLIQRTIDFFAEDLINKHKDYFPVYNFFIKNAVSMAFYELRRNQMNWFFDSEPPVNYDRFRLGLSFTF